MLVKIKIVAERYATVGPSARPYPLPLQLKPPCSQCVLTNILWTMRTVHNQPSARAVCMYVYTVLYIGTSLYKLFIVDIVDYPHLG